MKSTWKKSDQTRRRNMAVGCILFVIGIATCAYCGYMNRYVGDPPPAFVHLLGWGLLIVGLILFVFGLLQSPIRR